MGPDGAEPAWPEPAPAAPGSLVVDVVGTPGDVPLAGAEVEIDGGGKHWTRVTDADGTARFEGLEGDSISVEARAPGRVREVRSMDGLQRPVERRVQIALRAGARLSGRVFESESLRPIAGASVVARPGGAVEGMSVTSSEGPLVSTVSDVLGRFELDGMPLREVVTVTATARGRVPVGKSLMLGDGSVDHPAMEFALSPAGNVTGRVVDAEGQPVPEAQVHAIESEDTSLPDLEVRVGAWGLGSGPTHVAADSSGRFAFEGLALGKPWRLVARASGGRRSAVSDPPVTLERDRPHALGDLRLRAPGTLSIHVVDVDGGDLAGARVHMEVPGFDVAAATRLGPSTLRYEGLPPGTHEVLVSCPGYVSRVLIADVLEGTDVEARVVLEAGVTLEGSVVDDLGVGLEQAWVVAETVAPKGETQASEADREQGASSGAGGRFRIEGLRPGEHRVTARASGHGPSPSVRAVAPGADVRIVLPRTGTRRLRVLLPEGAPAEVDVAIVSEHVGGFGGRGTTRALGDGRISFVELPAGRVRLVVHVEGFAPWIQEEDVKPGSDRDLGDVRVDAGAELAGNVLDDQGTPVPGARLRVRLPTMLDDEVAIADSAGAYRVRRLPGGTTDVWIAAEGLLTSLETVELASGTTLRTFTLVRPVRLRGTVRSRSGSSTSGLRITATLEGERRFHPLETAAATTDLSGAFEMDVAPGIHVLEARGPTEDSAPHPLGTVTVPRSTPIELRIP